VLCNHLAPMFERFSGDMVHNHANQTEANVGVVHVSARCSRCFRVEIGILVEEPATFNEVPCRSTWVTGCMAPVLTQRSRQSIATTSLSSPAPDLSLLRPSLLSGRLSMKPRRSPDFLQSLPLWRNRPKPASRTCQWQPSIAALSRS
jgi:hypothetical protein